MPYAICHDIGSHYVSFAIYHVPHTIRLVATGAPELPRPWGAKALAQAQSRRTRVQPLRQATVSFEYSLKFALAYRSMHIYIHIYMYICSLKLKVLYELACRYVHTYTYINMYVCIYRNAETTYLYIYMHV